MNRDGIPALERQNPWLQRKHAKLESVFEEKILTAMGFDQRGPQFLRPRDPITGGEGGRGKRMGECVCVWWGGGGRGGGGGGAMGDQRSLYGCCNNAGLLQPHL